MAEAGSSSIAIGCVIPAVVEDELAEQLGGLEILGTQLGPVEAGVVPVTVYLRSGSASVEETVRRRIRDLGGEVVRVEAVPDEDWLERYRREVRPFEVGRSWWLDPHPERPTLAPSGRLRLVIEPRTAFGSGSHESTQLVLLELEVAPPVGLGVLDVGTGSGILALAAERLGARRVVGFDIDLGAVFVAHQIVAQQEWRSSVRLVAATIDVFRPGGFDLVLCNMIWEHARPMLHDLRRVVSAGGAIVLSGLLARDRGPIVTELDRAGLVVHGERALAEWLSLRVGRG